MGSASELDYLLLLARDPKLLKANEYPALAEATTEVKRMLSGLLQKLKARAGRFGCGHAAPRGSLLTVKTSGTAF
jgi:hypothetical protein